MPGSPLAFSRLARNLHGSHQDPVHICLCCQYYPPDLGAAAGRAVSFVSHWVAQGHRVTVLTGTPSALGASTGPDCPAPDGATIRRCWTLPSAHRSWWERGLNYGSYLTTSSLAASLQRERPDVVVASTPPPTVPLLGLAIATRHGCPLVLDVRDLWPEALDAVGVAGPTHPIYRSLAALRRATHRRADAVVVTTARHEAVLRGLGLQARRMAVVSNGADLSRMRPRPRDTALRRHLDLGDRCVAGYVGTHGLAQDLASVLRVAEALRREPEIHFLLAGGGARLDAVRRRAAPLANMTVLGPLPRDAVPEAYATADLAILPQRRGRLFDTMVPAKAFEWMACGRPIVLAGSGAARELVEAAGAGVVVPPESSSALRSAIEALATDPPRRHALGMAGRAWVEHHGDQAQLADEFLDLLRDVTR